MHGDETVGYILHLKLIQHLLSNYGTDARVTALLDSSEIWIAPLVNPDGTYNYSNGKGQYGATRYNSNRFDINRCFPGIGQPDGHELALTPEGGALVDLYTAEKFYMGADSHGGIEAVMLPWGYSLEVQAPTNRSVFMDLARTFDTKLRPYVICEQGPYAAAGVVFDYTYQAHSTVLICPELTKVKPIKEGDFDNQWNRFRDGYLALMEAALDGLHGTVLDAKSGTPIPALVAFKSLDADGYGIVESADLGNFYHTGTAGQFEVTVSPLDTELYGDTTLTITLKNGERTTLDLQLHSLKTAVNAGGAPSAALLSVAVEGDELRLALPEAMSGGAIHSLNGRQLLTLEPSTEKHCRVALGGLMPGSYVVRVQLSKGAHFRKISIQ